MSLLIISTSLSPDSRSRILAHHAHELARKVDQNAKFLDLRTINPPLPVCDGGPAYSHPAVASMKADIKAAAGVILAHPIYNYAGAASTKNLIELTGDAWEGKTVGLLAAAGGSMAYMGPMAIAQSLMLDFRCIVIPRYVYATGAAIENNAVSDAGTQQRIAQLVSEVWRVSRALAGG